MIANSHYRSNAVKYYLNSQTGQEWVEILGSFQKQTQQSKYW